MNILLDASTQYPEFQEALNQMVQRAASGVMLAVLIAIILSGGLMLLSAVAATSRR
jgi:hypothetical protein